MSGIMLAKGKIYDVFISYHESDKEWVIEELLEHLEGEEFSVCWDDRDFEPGKTIIENKLTALCSSSCTVVVLTSKYGADEDLWDTLIQKCCVDAQEIIREFDLVPILLTKCKVPDLFAPLWKLDWTNKVAQKFFWKKLTQTVKKITDRRSSQSYSKGMSTAEVARYPAIGQIGDAAQPSKGKIVEIENARCVVSMTKEVNGTYDDLESNIKAWKSNCAVEESNGESDTKDNNNFVGQIDACSVPCRSDIFYAGKQVNNLSIEPVNSNQIENDDLQPAEDLSLEHERKAAKSLSLEHGTKSLEITPALVYESHSKHENSDDAKCGRWLRHPVSSEGEHQKVVQSLDSQGIDRSKWNSNATKTLHDPNISEYDKNEDFMQKYCDLDTQTDYCPLDEDVDGNLSGVAGDGILEKVHPRIIGLFVPEDDDLTREDVEELTLNIEDVSLCDDNAPGNVPENKILSHDVEHIIEKMSSEKKICPLHRFNSHQEQILVLDFLQGQEMRIRKRFENCLDIGRKRCYRRLLEKFDKAICSTVNGKKDSDLLASLNISGLFENEHRGFKCSCCDQLFHSERALHLHMADCIGRAWRSILAFGPKRCKQSRHKTYKTLLDVYKTGFYVEKKRNDKAVNSPQANEKMSIVLKSV